MGPKKGNKASKKTEEKQKEKIFEDKTFGLKNKNKSKVVQSFVNQVQKQVKGDNEKKQLAQKKVKKDQAQVAAEMANLFNSAITQPKVPPGVDPKSIVCEFFKNNLCTKGNRCKYAHDLNVGKKSAKIDFYSDKRDAKLEDKMDTWDQEKLEQVISQKDEGRPPANQTDIVCKYFLDAIEKSQYGWFWVCPNAGTNCKYRHRLPPGFVFKTKIERNLEKLNKPEELSIEEIIELQRAKLGPTGGTPVTAESLAKWKADKALRKVKEEQKRKEENAKKTGGKAYMLSGRALFTFDPTLFHDDMDASADSNAYAVANCILEDVENKIDENLYLDDQVVKDLDKINQ